MKFFSVIMISLLLVAISLVSSTETGNEEQQPKRLARAAGGKGECFRLRVPHSGGGVGVQTIDDRLKISI